MTTQYYGPKSPAFPNVIRIDVKEIAWDNQNAGYAAKQYDVVYLDQTYWRAADAHNTNKVPSIGVGMVVASSVSGFAGMDVWIRAQVSNGGWLFVSGANVYLASGGGVVMSAPTASGDWILQLGRAAASNLLDFGPITPIQQAV